MSSFMVLQGLLKGSVRSVYGFEVRAGEFGRLVKIL